jgi:dTDP-4-dehydrorhamnose reductase
MPQLRVVVTGAQGLLGSVTMKTLVQRGHEAITFEGDLTKSENVERAIKEIGRANALIHAAAITDVNQCERERVSAYASNVMGTRAARDIATALGARLLYISTASVFDGQHGDYREDDLPYPKNWYNLTKYAGEEIVRDVPHSLIVRMNLIGVHPGGSKGRGTNFAEWLLNTIRDGEDMNLFTDVRINPLSNYTIAELLIELLEKDVDDRILHIGSKNIVSKADVGKAFLEKHSEYSGHATYTTSDALSALAHRPKEMWLNVERAAVVFGRELPTVEQELERILLNL